MRTRAVHSVTPVSSGGENKAIALYDIHVCAAKCVPARAPTSRPPDRMRRRMPCASGRDVMRLRATARAAGCKSQVGERESFKKKWGCCGLRGRRRPHRTRVGLGGG